MTSVRPSEESTELTDLAQRVAGVSATEGIPIVSSALAERPKSARLLFLRGSLRAETGDYEGALSDFSSAVGFAPDFAIARFQWGLLTLCLGREASAQQILEPLDELPVTDALRLFKEGLLLLSGGQPVAGVERLKAGQRANLAYPPLNRDMQLLIDRAMTPDHAQATEPTETSNDSHVLLSGYLTGITKH